VRFKAQVKTKPVTVQLLLVNLSQVHQKINLQLLFICFFNLIQMLLKEALALQMSFLKLEKELPQNLISPFHHLFHFQVLNLMAPYPSRFLKT
jgi:hypothetical protein